MVSSAFYFDRRCNTRGLPFELDLQAPIHVVNSLEMV